MITGSKVYHKHTRCSLQGNKMFSLRKESRLGLVRASRVWSMGNGASREQSGDEVERIFLYSLRGILYFSLNGSLRSPDFCSAFAGSLFAGYKMFLCCCQLVWPFILHIVGTKDYINACIAERNNFHRMSILSYVL